MGFVRYLIIRKSGAGRDPRPETSAIDDVIRSVSVIVKKNQQIVFIPFKTFKSISRISPVSGQSNNIAWTI